MYTLNGDGNRVFGDFGCDDMVDSARLEESLLPEQIRHFLLKKYRRLFRNQTQPRRLKLDDQTTHKPAFIFLVSSYAPSAVLSVCSQALSLCTNFNVSLFCSGGTMSGRGRNLSIQCIAPLIMTAAICRRRGSPLMQRVQIANSSATMSLLQAAACGAGRPRNTTP